MKINTLLATAAVLLSVISLDSCKKEEEQESKPYLEGRLQFSASKYIAPETELEFEATGAIHPENKGIGYSWKVTPGMEKADTVKTEDQDDKTTKWSYKFGKELRQHTVTVQAYANGYYSISASRYVTTVKGGLDGSITDTGIKSTDETFTDSRDGKVYYVATIGSTKWMRNNLCWEGAGMPFDNEDAMNDVLGRYYSWNEAQNACPEGWTLPAEADVKAMAEAFGGKPGEGAYSDIDEIAGALMADAKFNGNKMWEFWPENKITNTSGLAFIPAGFANIQDGTVSELLHYATFWTSDKVSKVDGDYGICRYIVNVDKGDRKLRALDADLTTFGANVRCIKK